AIQFIDPSASLKNCASATVARMPLAAARRLNYHTFPSSENKMSNPSVKLGYAIFFVKDVYASLAFYEQAFGLSRRFFSDDHGKAYGELETGAACLAFASLEMAK